MGRHQVKKPRTKRVPLADPNTTQTVKHSCGCVKTYDGLGPKFDLEGIKAEVAAREARPCKVCRLKAKEEAKKAAAEQPTIQES